MTCPESQNYMYWSWKSNSGLPTSNNGLVGIVQRRKTASGSCICLSLFHPIGWGYHPMVITDGGVNKPPHRDAGDLASILCSTINSWGDFPAPTPLLGLHALCLQR